MTKNSPTRSTRPAITLYRSPVATIRNPQRRGILLLVVLSLLVLFLLVGTSFITSSNNHRLTSKTLSRPYEAATNPLQHTDLLDQTLNQLVRDSSNPYSSLAGHSLLNDLYGLDGVLISPTSPQTVRFVDRSGFEITLPGVGLVNTANLDNELLMNTGNQFFWAAVELPLDPNNPVREDFYKGRLFTMLDGPAAGRTARVIRFFYDDVTRAGDTPSWAPQGVAQALFYLMLLDSDRNFSAAELDIQPSHVAVINGQPFNGTGAGYNVSADPNGPLLDARENVLDVDSGSDVPREIALMPNPIFFNTGKANEIQSYSNLWTGIGGADESYDAVDFQNMALAWSPVNPVERVTFGSSSLGDLVIPSFHRPALINYWVGQVPALATQTGEPNLLRKILLRPFGYDHPNFTGSNAEYEANLSDPNAALRQMVYGPWDVDNDGDGRRDSVWVDAGLPVMEGPQGVLVKPLVAILCIDLDSRLNLNTHGTLDLAGLGFDPPPVTLADGVSTNALAEGQAYGPAEISLQAVLEGNLDDDIRSTNTESLFTRILVGVPAADGAFLNGFDNTFTQAIGGRYGHRWQSNTWETPGVRLGYDLLAQLKQQGMPQHVVGQSPGNDPNDWLGNYATPPDLNGRYALGLNALGQPVYEAFGDPSELDIDSPYELNLSRLGPQEAGNLAQDGPFTVAELEKILRAYDKDSGKLPSRLWDLANGFVESGSTARLDAEELQEWRGLLTTDSFDIPVANVTLPEWMHNGPDRDPNTADDFSRVMGRQPVNLTFADLLEYRLRIAPVLDRDGDGSNEDDIRRELRKLLAPELAAGERFDLNRPFGNGRDDNNNGVVDEPGEWRDADNDGVFDAGEVEAPFWNIDETRLSTAMTPAMQAFEDASNVGQFRDNIDRNGDGDIEPWERGDYLPDNNSNNRPDSGDGDGVLSHVELVTLHNFRRQLYARHLYVLAMTLVDPLEFTSPPTPQERLRLENQRAQRLAQWAINVADFRDPDSISTAFEYDNNPFDGWLPDGDMRDPNDVYGADRKVDTGTTITGNNQDRGGVVWGAETQGSSLKITETLAWHDRKTIDEHEPIPSKDEPEDILLEDESNDPRTFRRYTRHPDKNDRSYDQFERPQGAAFIELYNPWPQQTAANADVHAVEGFNGVNTNLVPDGTDLGINLAAFGRNPTDPSDRSKWSPAWRIMVYRQGGVGLLPENKDPILRPGHVAWTDATYNIDGTPRDSIIDQSGYRYDASMLPEFSGLAERTIYFTAFDPADAADGNIDRRIQANANGIVRWDGSDGVGFYSSIPVPPVRPGRYMVVAGVDTETQATGNPNEYLIPFGFSADRGVRLQTDSSSAQAVSVMSGVDRGNPVRDRAADMLMQSPAEPDQNTANQLGMQSLLGMGFASTSSIAIINSAVPNSFYGKNYTTPSMRRFTFSEPADGYPDRVYIHRSQSEPSANINPVTKRYGNNRRQALDVPLDDRRTFDPTYLRFFSDPDRYINGVDGLVKRRQRNSAAGIVGRPTSLNDGEVRLQLPVDKNALRTLVGFRWIYLQRLRNPTLPWNPERFDLEGNLDPKYDPNLAVNPYTTVDASAVNLTLFNDDNSGSLKGERAYPPMPKGTTIEQVRAARSERPLDYANDMSLKTFSSVQRGRSNIPGKLTGDLFRQQAVILEGRQSIRNWDRTIIRNPETTRSDPREANLWSEEPAVLWKNESANTDPNGRGLGYERVADTHNMKGIPDCTLGYLNEPYRDPNYVGAHPDIHKRLIPRNPFSSVVWNDRDYANSGEVLFVPAYSTAEMIRVVTSAAMTNRDPNTGTIVPTPGEYAAGTWQIQGLLADGPFAHLMNFFRSEPATTGVNNPNPGTVGMSRVLDYLSVPSRYVGTETWLSPVQFGSNSDPVTTADARYALQPPFNKLGLNRDPGRVNINTIGAGGSGAVWFGMFHGRTKYNGEDGAHAAVDDDGFFSVRRGYGTFGDGVGLLDPAYPTLVGNPFRSSGAARHVPIPQMLRQEVEGTTLRTMGGPPFTNSSFVPSADPNGVPLLSTGLVEPRWNSARNAYFRYEPIKRLSSFSTTHSNVYAVWITIGFFEVSEAPAYVGSETRYGNNPAVYNRVYPEGYQFGREYGIDTGSEVRLRQFAIIDRSIPVAFEPGKNHNTEKAIRLKRRIE